jgi:hypothetical protein
MGRAPISKAASRSRKHAKPIKSGRKENGREASVHTGEDPPWIYYQAETGGPVHFTINKMETASKVLDLLFGTNANAR